MRTISSFKESYREDDFAEKGSGILVRKMSLTRGFRRGLRLVFVVNHVSLFNQGIVGGMEG